MELNNIILLVTAIVTFVCGLIAKKIRWFNNKLIPIQNLLIGIFSAIIYYFITKDIDLVIATIGLATGGTYDIIHNIEKLFKKESDINE